MTLTGDPRRWAAEPGIPGVVRIHDPYYYRSGWPGDVESFTAHLLNQLEDTIRFENPDNIAAIIMEPVTGTNGIIIPPDGYMQGVRYLCDKYGIMFIADEVMSGFGRTGEWFAVNHWGVEPDIMSIAKGLTSSYMPLGATVVSEEIGSYFDNKVLYAGLTYGGHAMGCAAAIACINVYKEDNLIERSREMGKYLGEWHEKLKAKHPSVGDARYIGMFSILEIVKNRETREPMAPFNAKAAEMGPMAVVNKFFRDNGLFTFVRWNNILVNPPLTITKEELDEGMEIIDQALEITDDSVVE
jgi:taurine--2-oxoglutarate transaminase